MPVADGLDIVPREVWAGARQPTSAMPPEDVRFLLVHHTAGGNNYGAGDVPGILRQIYDFHTGPEKGWADVCYNFFVDRFGVVWEGRAGSIAGAVTPDATGGNQGFSQLVCVIGDYTSVMPTDAAIESTVRTLAWLADRFGIDTTPAATVQFVSRGSNRWAAGQLVTASTVSGHRDMSATACPGDTFYPYVVSTLRDRVHAASGALVSDRPSAAPPTFAPITAAPATTEVTAPTSTARATSPLTPPEPVAINGSEPGITNSTVAAPVTGASPPVASFDVVDATDDGGVGWSPVVLVAGGVALGAGVLAVRDRQR